MSNEFLKLLIIPFLVKLVILSARSGTKYLSFRLHWPPKGLRVADHPYRGLSPVSPRRRLCTSRRPHSDSCQTWWAGCTQHPWRPRREILKIAKGEGRSFLFVFTIWITSHPQYYLILCERWYIVWMLHRAFLVLKPKPVKNSRQPLYGFF